MSERVLSGAPASPGLAIGRARVLSPPSEDAARDPGPARAAAAEAEHAREALRQAAAELEGIAAALRADGRPDDAEIVETGALMAADPLLESAVSAAVTERGRSAAAALLEATEEHALVIASLPDALLAARADDVRSLGRRAARNAAGGAGDVARRNGSAFILVAEDLGPADVAEHGDQLAGIALSGGGVTAHAAIVARSLGIPMTVLAGPELLQTGDGAPIVVDGGEGTVILEPSAERSGLASAALEDRAHARAREKAESSLPAVTADGRRVRVLVNAATPAEIRAGLAAGAEGAGLIRTELAFLDAPGWPSREQHVQMLAPLLAGLAGRTATVRVLDFGGDKLPPFLRGEPRRGIELLLAHPGAFRAQLGAIAQLAGDADVRVLLPMVRSAVDVNVTRAILATLGGALEVGAMIELPDAALAATEIAAGCDFLSIGTNDLTHTTLGTDRFAHGEAPAHDPRVLGHIASTAHAARAAGIPLEVCGEAASDPLTVPLLVGLGADELSVGAARVGALRAWIRALDHGECERLARRALKARDALEVEALARPLSSAAAGSSHS
jgi:phosphoenolpyruvate-protein kinase (PTS system EI component)